MAGLLLVDYPKVERYTPKQLETWLEGRKIGGGMDGAFYQDMREPFFVTDITATAITTTASVIYTAAQFPPLGANYFNRPGKMLKIRLWLKIAATTTPGNISFNVHWGTGAAANGTLICVAGTPVAMANVTKGLYLEVTVRCLTAGSTGTLEATGWAICDPALVASTLQPMMIPTAGAAASASLDLTAANVVSVQMLASGTGGTTAQMQQMEVVACN